MPKKTEKKTINVKPKTKAKTTKNKEWSTTNPVGRPRLYTCPEELQFMIDKYINEGCLVDRYSITGEHYQEQHPTITGLVLFCGFADRRSFYDYEDNENFSYTIKRARTFIENWYEKNLFAFHTGSIFALKQFGWTDRQEIRQETIVKSSYEKLLEIADKEGLSIEDYARREGINLDDYR